MNTGKRARDLALMLREILAVEDASPEVLLDPEMVDKANRLLSEGNEVSEYDQELQNYQDAFKGMKTRKEIESEIARVEGFEEHSSMAELINNTTHVNALKWCLSAGAKKPRE